MKFWPARSAALSAGAVLAALGACRALTLGLGHFHTLWEQGDAWRSIVPGVMSDAGFATGFFLLVLLVLPRGHKFLAPVTMLSVLLIAAHFRFMEHFGWVVRPSDWQLLNSAASADMAGRFFVTSWRSLAIVAFAGAWWGLARRVIQRPRVTSTSLMALAITATALIFASEGAANRFRCNAELRRAPLLQVAVNMRQHRLENPDLALPGVGSLAELRAAFGGDRPYADSTGLLPIWQESVWSGRPTAGPDERLRSRLEAYLRAEAAKHGPWNVVVVQNESLRQAVLTKDAAPALNRLFATGIRFTRMIASGNLTHFGELALGCSLPAMPFFNIFLDEPSTPVTCLPDTLRRHGYGTWFFSGTEPRINHRDEFYPAHGSGTQVSLRDAPAGAPRTVGWGLTDAATYGMTLETLTGAPNPFYAHVLTVSNHFPWDIPPDAPKDRIVGYDTVSRQRTIVSYTDWAFPSFYEKLVATNPHTIVWFTADHGEWPEAGYPDTAPWARVQELSGIPAVLLIPGLPDDLKGQVVDRLASDVDFAPTLLGLLGYTDQPNQFLGEDLFRRSAPVTFLWGQQVRQALQQAGAVEIGEPWSQDMMETWSAIGKFGRLAPRRPLSASHH